MKKNSIRVLAWILVVFTIISTFPVSVFAEEGNTAVESEASSEPETALSSDEGASSEPAEQAEPPATITKINSVADLKAFADSVNAGNTYAGETVELCVNLVMSGVEWTPIGNGTRSSKNYSGNAFKGTFDGGDYTIDRLTITSTAGDDAAVGLFGVVDGGTVKNLTLTNVNVNVPSSNLAGGAIGMMLNGATADNITVSGAVVGNDGVGGIVGRLVINGTISKCINNASVTSAYGGIGGIVGKAYYEDGSNTELFANVTKCTNNGTITAPMYVGGIVGLARANVTGCVNNGAVVGGTQTGGIIGQLIAAGTVSGNENKAKISGKNHLGGIIGDYSQSNDYTYNNVTIANNINRGELVATEQCAAIMGCNNIDGFTAMTASGNESHYYVDGLELFGNPEDMVIDATNKFILPPVAKIGETGYATFAAALTAASALTGDVTVKILGEVEFVNGMELNGSYTSISFVGEDTDAKMTINQTAGGDYLEAHGKTVSFTNLTLAKANPAWHGNSGHMGNYFSVQGGTVTYTNCTFPNGACTSGGTATYTGCTFQNASEYGLWVYDDALVTVNGGTIDSKKGVKVYSEDEGSVTSTLTVQNATFTENVTAKPAVAIGYAESITLIGNTYNNPTVEIELDSGSDADCEGITFVAQDAEGNDIASTLEVVDRSNSNAACGVLVDGKIYTTVTEAVKEAESGDTVTLLYASNETVKLPVGVTLNNNGFTAAGVTETIPVAKIGETTYYSLEEAFAAAAAGDTIKLLADVTFSGQNAADKLSGHVIDLNDKTMTLSGNTYLTGETTIKNGNIVVSGFVSDSYLCLYTADTKLTLDDVALTGTMDCYAVLNAAAGSTLIIKDSTIDVVGNVTNPDAMGNIIYGGNVTVDHSTIKGDNTVRGIGFSNITIQNHSSVEISNVETGLNCATVTVDTSTVTITNATKRAVRLSNNALTLQNGATLTATNCAEGIIGIGTTDTVSVSSDSTLNAKDNVTPTYVAYIGEQGYETLAAAVLAAQSGDTITLENGDYTLPEFANKELTFVGVDKANTSITDWVNKGSQGMMGSTVHFENLTVNGQNENYYGLFHTAEVTYENCNINGLRFLYAPTVSFEDCAFNAEGVEHSFWTYGASNVTVTNCTFTYTDRAVNCYSENGASHEVDIAFSGCEFTYAGTAATPEGAVEINSGSVKSIDLTMDDCTAPANGAMWFNSQWDSKDGANTTVTKDGDVVWRVAKGNDFTGYTDSTKIWGEAWGNATESFVIKVLDANGNVMGTTSLNNVNGIINGDVNVTWSILLDAASNTDEFWTMSWITAPTINNQPAKVELWVDGVKVSGGDVVLNGPDDIAKIYAAVTDNSGKILGYYTTLKSAMEKATATDKIVVMQNITESMDSLKGNIITNNPNGVTIKNTIVDAWIYCGENFTIGEGVTYDATGAASGLFVYAENAVINGTVLTDCYYQRYANTKLTINEPGSMTVKTETFILRYTDGDGKAGIYIVGDNNDETVGLNASVIYFYQGIINAKDADIKVGTYWQTNETDNQGSANLVLDNSNMTVTVNEHNMKATGTSTVTLTNGSHVAVAGGYQGAAVAMDETSTFTKNGKSILVAKTGDKGYATLAEAIAAVEEGGTVTLLSDVTIDQNTRVNSSGIWYEGVYYQGDKSFTIDLNGKTLTQDGSVNDYLMLFKNEGAKANTITLKNGTIDAGTSAYCAVCTSTTSTQKITINVENINIVGNNSDGAVLKIRGGAELNVKAGTVITGKNNYVGIEAAGTGTVINIYADAKIYQQGTGSYVGSLVGASGGATVNVYGGYGESASGGFIAMTSGGTINISGGEWIANTDGTYANSNKSVLIAQSNKQYTASIGNSVINVTGGTFKGGYNCYGDKAGDAQINISGGNFSADPSDYCANGFVVKQNADGTYSVVEKAMPTVNGVDVVISDKGDGAFDITLNAGASFPEVGVTMTFPATGDTNGMAYVVHEHDGVNYIYVGKVSDGKLSFKNTVGFSTFTVVDGGLQEALNAAAAGTGNITVEILVDINLTGIDWTPVTVSAPGYPMVTVNGNDKTITGLNDMLFAGTWAGNSGLIINDLTIANSTIVHDENDAAGNIGVGAFIGFPQASATITLNNCHLVNSTVKGGHWTGGLIGYAAGYAGTDGPVFMNLTIGGCSVTGSTITGKGSAGGIIGHATGNAWTDVAIENTTVSGNTVTSTGSSTNKAGAVVGTIGAAGQATTVNGVEHTGGVSVSATVSGNTVTSNGTTITTVYGRQGTDTGMLEIAGGSYDSNPIEENVSYAAPKEGHMIVDNGNGTYGLEADPAYGKAAKIGDTYYATLAEAITAAQAGNEIVLLCDTTEDVTIPAGVIFNGNGKQVGTIIAAGEITFKGHTKATNFSVQYTNTTINIGEGACLEINGTGRMVIGHGCTFNITGTITDAKNANTADLTPSLIMPGASFTGAGVTFNVTNAYIKAPSSYCSSSSSASGTFDFNITNSIIETAGKLAFEAQSTAATVYFDLKDSVLTTGSHLVFGVSSGEIVIDNSNVNVGTSRQIENQSTMIVKNGSVVNGAVATSSNAKNPGTLTIDNATYAVTGEFSGSDLGTGTLIVKKGASFAAGSITKANIQIDATGMQAGDEININANLTNLAGTIEVVNNSNLEAKIVDGKIVLSKKPVASIGGTTYATLEEAFKAATDGCTIEILADVVVDYKWDCRDYATNGSHSQFNESVTINGNDHTITFTGTINDNNWNTVFRFEENATVNNLTIDISAATGAQRVISAKKSLTVDDLTIIGSAKYGIIFGEGASATELAATEIVIKNSTLAGTRRAISDNEGGKDVKSIVITDNTLNANVYVSASESIVFNNNTAAGEVDLRSYTADTALAVEAKDNTLNTAAKNYILAKTIVAQDEFDTAHPAFKVATKAELNAALAAAADGDTIILTADIDYGTDQLKIEKAITLDLGGKTLTTRNAYGGMSVKNNPTIKNGTIVHASNTAAIKVWNAVAFEDLVIDVQGKGDANKIIGGIVLQSGTTTRVDSIKNVTIKGAALTNGIETYNCGDAAADVIGSMENVNIDANGTGMLISAPCGTATNCTINGGNNAIEIFVKGTYSASLDLVDCDVEGSIFAHDEFSSDPTIVNNGTLNLTVDTATTGADEVTLTLARAENVEGVLKDIKDNAQATVNNTYYATLAEALAVLQANGGTLELLADASINASVVVLKDTVINGNGKKLTVTGAYGIDVKAGVNLAINNLTVESNLYALNLRGASNDAVVTITNSNLTGCIALNVWGENVVVNATNSAFTSVDTATHENYSAIALNNNGTKSAENTVINVTGGSITALDENGAPSIAIRNATATGVANVSDTTVVTGEISEVVSIVTYNGNDAFYSHFTLQESINRAANDPTATVKLLKDITISEGLVIEGNVTIDLNGKTITSGVSTIVVDGGELTIIDATNTGKIITTDATGDYEAIAVKNGGKLTLNGGNVESECHGIYAYTSGGHIVMNGGSITLSGANKDGMAIAVGSDLSSATITGGKINANGVNWPMYSWSKPIAVSGGVFSWNPNADYIAIAEGKTVEPATEAGYYQVVDATPIAYIGTTGYYTINDAIKAAQAGDTIIVNSCIVNGNVSINKDVTVQAAEGATVTINGDLSITADGATVKGIDVVSGGTALYINAKDVLVEDCEITGAWSGMYQSYTTGKVTFKDSKITGKGAYAIHFDGSAGGEIVIDNCELSGWTSFASTIKNVTITGTDFVENDVYNYVRFYQENVVIDDCTFNEKMSIDVAVDDTTVTVTGSTVTNGTVEDLFTDADIANNTITVDGTALARVAKIGDTYYETLADALNAAKGEKNIVIELVNDATLDITAWQTLAIGGDATETITINGNVNTLTFNKLNSDWNNIATNNDAKLILNNMTITDSGYNNGPWNRYDLNFACDVELNNVKATKALAFKADATLNNVEINETGDNYAIWIQPNGQKVAIDGLTVTSAGRGIKIDQQYVDAPAEVTLSVEDAKFTTAKKAAILVKSTAGADIALTNVDISEVAADTVNAVWNDSDAGAEYGDITVTGGTLAQEDATAFTAAIVDGDKVVGYYKTLQAAIDAAVNGDTITLLADCAENVTVVQAPDKAITIDGNNKTFTGFITVDGKSAAYATTGLIIQNVEFVVASGATAIHLGVSGNNNTRYTSNVTIDNCTFTGTDKTAAGIKSYTGGDKNLTITGCTATGMHSLVQLKNVAGVTVSNTTITDGKNGISLGASSDVEISGSTIDVTGYGVRADGNDSIGSPDAQITNCTIKANQPVVVRNMTSNYDLEITGGTLTAPADGYAVTFTAGDDGVDPVEPTGKFNATLTEVEGKVYPTSDYVAKIGEKSYFTFEAALNAAQSGETVTLLADLVDEDKVGMVMLTQGITLDLNGYTLAADYLVAFNGAYITDKTNGSGFIKIAKDNMSIAPNNVMIPVYNGTDGYIFTTVGYSTAISEVEGAMRFVFLPKPNAKVVELLKNGCADNQINILIQLSWTTDQGTQTQELVYKNEWVEQVYSNNPSLDNGGTKFFVDISGYENITGLKVNAAFVSTFGPVDASTQKPVN